MNSEVKTDISVKQEDGMDSSKKTGEVCKYCQMLENGDVPEDRENVINITVGSLSGTDVRIIGTLCNNELNVCLDTGTTDKGYDVRIRYCPMCGRDLSTPFASQKGRS